MTRVLITGARSPAALELCRRFAVEGVEVYAADCLRFPLARMSNAVKGYIRLPSPRFDRDGFAAELSRVIDDRQIDLVVPTCEEAFHLSAIKDRLPERARYFVDSIETLDTLHNKYTFQHLLNRGDQLCGPRSELVSEKAEILRIAETGAVNGVTVKGIVYKRAYSRFAEGTLVKPGREVLTAVDVNERDPFVAQEFIDGVEFCIYAIANEGALKAITIYRPIYRAGLGAGIYFEPVDMPDIVASVASFVAHWNLHGQISFDLIRERGTDKAYLIECNPRATSGIHLIGEDANFRELFGVSPSGERVPHRSLGRARMVGLAMFAFGLKNRKSLIMMIRDLRGAKDVIWKASDKLPLVGQLLSMIELMWIAHRRRVSLLAATTMDIEWNGPDE